MLYWPKLDDSANNIVAYVVSNGPVTMYRVARDLNLHFSHAYRKSKKLEDSGLLTSIRGPRSSLYDATVRGLLYAYVAKLASREIILKKLRVVLGLHLFSLEEVESFIKFFLTVANKEAPVGSLAPMVSYILDKCGSDYTRCMANLDERDRVLASRVMAYGIIKLIHNFFGDSLVVADEGYYAIVKLSTRQLLAVQCKLCGREKYCSLDPCPSLKDIIEVKLRDASRLVPAF